ncbi:hypothetical protein FB567DRAFT_593754 [Paraphoma chrysanthemicola]|uniref:Mid2 domain-containing protein n=1 Tax=Paraphoma chrysanthemicola TaxID=798071 RepID=A0A8K0R592_9PLEO|nr:hypothetical protein FB567DRAFT_593754 [Paraphoma chrysanthemicola]
MLPRGIPGAVTVVLLLTASDVAAQSSSVSFIYPPKPTPTTSRLIVDVVDTIAVQWRSNFQDASLWVYCDESTPGKVAWKKWYNLVVEPTGNATYSPSRDSDMNKSWDKPFNCHIDLNWENAAGQGINGPGINITSAAGKVATTYSLQATTTSLSSLGAATPTPSSNVSPDATPNASQLPSAASPISTTPNPTAPADIANNSNTSNSSTTTSSKKSSSLSTGAKAGIAIGAILGVLALLALGLFLYRRRRNVTANQQGSFGEDKYAKPQGVAVMASDSTLDTRHDRDVGQAPPYQQAMRHEAPGKTTYAMELLSPVETHELPGGVVGGGRQGQVEK